MINWLLPCHEREAIENLPVDGVAGWDKGVVEVVAWVVGHADPLHDPTRPVVPDGCERHDLAKPKAGESEVQRRRACLSRVAVAPRFLDEAPADFDRAEMGRPRAAAGPLHRHSAAIVRH